jgi:hypothetical protein
MARKSSLPDFHIHIPTPVVDVTVFCFSFVVIAALAGLIADLVHWS